MFGNKNSYLPCVALFLVAILTLPAQAKVVSHNSVEKSYFSSTNASDESAKSTDPQLNNDLVYRVAFGRAEDVKILLDQNADPNTVNPANIPVLIIAIIRKDDEAPKIVKYLIKAGAKVNVATADGNMPIIEAVKNGRTDILQLLIDNKAVLGGITDAQGHDLQTLAENRADLQIISVLNAGMDSEKEKLQALKSQDNFIRLVQEYSYLNCANEYLNFYLTTEPQKVDALKFDKIITKNSDDIDDTARKIKLIFKMGDAELQTIKVNSRQEIIARLQYYETNANRELNGFGTDDDLNKRCMVIAKKWDLKNLNKGQYELNTQ